MAAAKRSIRQSVSLPVRLAMRVKSLANAERRGRQAVALRIVLYNKRMPMVCRKFVPGPPLSRFVKCFWYSEGAPETHAKERLMPTGEPDIVFALRDDPIRLYDTENLTSYQSYGFAVLSGPRTGCSVIETKQEDRVFGIQFQPGGAFPFFREPASVLKESDFKLEGFWKRPAAELRERLLEADSPEAMFALAEKYLFAQLVRPLELHPAVFYARERFCRAPHVTTVASVLGRIGLSQRRFTQLFCDQVGLTPKVFCRVRRFQRVLNSIQGLREAEWVQVALDGGYYDQPHFNHDFRAFSGLTPEQYLARATEHLNHVAAD
jgi:AraC-like DNA-binding protein